MCVCVCVCIYINKTCGFDLKGGGVTTLRDMCLVGVFLFCFISFSGSVSSE